MSIVERVRRRLDSLEPETRRRVDLFLVCASDQGIGLRVAQATRTVAEQAALYAQGRAEPQRVNLLREAAGLAPFDLGVAAELNRATKKVTNAGPGWSFHNFGRAIDVVPMIDVDELKLGDARPDWEAVVWPVLGDLAESCGLAWGGRWTHPDRPHFQNEDLSLSTLRLRFPHGFPG